MRDALAARRAEGNGARRHMPEDATTRLFGDVAPVAEKIVRHLARRSCVSHVAHTLSQFSRSVVCGVMFCVELCGVLHLFRLVVMLRLLRPNQFAPLLFLQYSCVVVAIKFQKNQNSSIFLFSKQKKKLFAMLIFPSAVFHAIFHRDNLKDKIDLTSFVHRKASRKGNKFSNASSLGLVPNQFEIGIAFSIFAKTKRNEPKLRT